MDKKTTNPVLENLIAKLKEVSAKEKRPLWKRVANDLSRARRQRREVNLNKINNAIRDGETAIVPGKVLSDGELTKKVSVAAWQFTKKAKEKVKQNGRVLTIQELIKENPKGSKIRIVG